MSEVRADRWLNLVGRPAFLSSVRPRERSWRPLAAVALMAPLIVLLGLVGYLFGGVINSSLNAVLVLHEVPSWPANPFVAARTGLSDCNGCLMGGMATTVMVAMISGASMVAVLTAAAVVYRRPAKSWITAAPRFRWRLFWTGLVLFGLALGAAASVPEATHGWPDRPVFLRSGETAPIRFAYVAAMLVALPIAAACEEVLCRGWLLQATAAFTRSLPAILLVNSLIFSLLHLDADPGRNLSRALLGMALSWGALRTGGLELSIGIHAANNLVILMLAQTLKLNETLVASSPGTVAVNVAVALAAVATVELVARWGPLRRWSGLDLDASDLPQPPAPPVARRANSTLAAP